MRETDFFSTILLSTPSPRPSYWQCQPSTEERGLSPLVGSEYYIHVGECVCLCMCVEDGESYHVIVPLELFLPEAEKQESLGGQLFGLAGTCFQVLVGR